MYKWTEITSIDTILYSDSTEISPNGEYCINCCYQLNENNRVREGSFSLIDIKNKPVKIVTEVLNTDGILDCVWFNNNSVAFAGATGKLYFYNSDFLSLNLLNAIEINNNSLCLSIDYFNNKFLTTTSEGELCVLDDQFNILCNNKKVHTYEAWVGHLSRYSDSVCYTGGDDCFFKSIDFRCDFDNKKGEIFSKKFDMGVTSIQSHPIDANIISVGGYDERLRLWDLRDMRREVVDAVDVGGGVWRHKWCPEGGPRVLVAAMYVGFGVVNIEQGSVLMESAETHKGGLGYGADWVKRDSDYWVTLSSFYNHRWSLSTLENSV